ncbi:MAG TPA: hypothetical protein VG308_14140 [Stellaceae bacterium]|nr:hypothetical protein [Stellaceae bacterium]
MPIDTRAQSRPPSPADPLRAAFLRFLAGVDKGRVALIPLTLLTCSRSSSG